MRISDWSSDVCSSDLCMAARDLCDTAMRIALLEPDIAGNLGTILRLSACLGVAVDVLEPCGFLFYDRPLKRDGTDYAVQAEVQRPPDWVASSRGRRGRTVRLDRRRVGEEWVSMGM